MSCSEVLLRDMCTCYHSVSDNFEDLHFSVSHLQCWLGSFMLRPHDGKRPDQRASVRQVARALVSGLSARAWCKHSFPEAFAQSRSEFESNGRASDDSWG